MTPSAAGDDVSPTTRACRYHAPGPPSVMVFEDIVIPPPGPGEVRVRHTAIGVNFLDVNLRSGAYPSKPPAGLGTEGVGVVVATGPGVVELVPGDRVAYFWKVQGAYCVERNVPAERLLRIPSELEDALVGASFAKGLTVEYLIRKIFPLSAGNTLVVTAAAGGLGTLLCGWARALGARVIGVVSAEAKARWALDAGAHHVLVAPPGSQTDLARAVRAIVPGGVDVVYDSVGRETFTASLDMLRPRGVLALFGQASGPVPPVDPMVLMQKGSLFLTRPSLGDYSDDAAEYRDAAGALFDALRGGRVMLRAPMRLALQDAASAHAALESRKTTGAIVLVP